jgi:hypothetical protein
MARRLAEAQGSRPPSSPLAPVRSWARPRRLPGLHAGQAGGHAGEDLPKGAPFGGAPLSIVFGIEGCYHPIIHNAPHGE